MFISSQHLANNHLSPKMKYPGVAVVIKRYFKAHHGEATSFVKNPLLSQDKEHMIDVCGIESPEQLQSKTGIRTAYSNHDHYQ